MFASGWCEAFVAKMAKPRVWCRRASRRGGAPDDAWLITLPPSLDLACRLITSLLNRLGVGVLVGPQFKIDDVNTTEA